MSDLPSVFQLALPVSPGAVAESGLSETSCDALLQESVRLGVFAAVYSNLRKTECRPRDANRWDRRLQANGARNLFLKREQGRVLMGLREAGIACFPVRGVALTEAPYPDLFWREIADIDLLIAAADVPRAYPVLKAIGLDDTENPWTDAALERLARRASYHYPELRMSGSHSVSVELHWDWVDTELPRGDLLSDRDAYLVYLCRHAAKHL